ncbi:MAG: hypothetical protein J6K92_11235 [Oscillospiraceae bacterium]|nr:hypothetical protein [Oscillospiraceae bacterium]
MNDTGFAFDLILSVLTSVIAENFVFARAFGITPMIAAAKNNRTLPGVCIGVSYFTLAASAAMYFVSQLSADGVGDRHFLVALYAFIVGGIYLMTLLCIFLFARTKFSKIKKYVHISAFNSAVMGTIFLSASGCTALGEYLIFGLTAGAGFTAASYMLSGVYPRLYSEDVPRAFRGFPAVMIFSGIMAMAVYGILGHAPSFI